MGIYDVQNPTMYQNYSTQQVQTGTQGYPTAQYAQEATQIPVGSSYSSTTTTTQPVEANNNHAGTIGATLGLIGGGILGYQCFPKTASANDIAKMDTDTFTKSMENAKKSNPSVANKVTHMKDILTNLINTEDKKVETKFHATNGQVSTADYLKGIKFNSVDELDKTIENQAKYNAQLTDLLQKSTNDAQRKAYNNAIYRSNNKITELNAHKILITNAQGGAINLQEIKNAHTSLASGKVSDEITKGLSQLGKDAPKVKSLKHAGIGAIAGAIILGGISKLLFGGKKEPEAQQLETTKQTTQSSAQAIQQAGPQQVYQPMTQTYSAQQQYVQPMVMPSQTYTQYSEFTPNPMGDPFGMPLGSMPPVQPMDMTMAAPAQTSQYQYQYGYQYGYQPQVQQSPAQHEVEHAKH